VQKIETVWKNSQNSELLSIKYSPLFSNFFTTVIPATYAQAHLDTATYLFQHEYDNEALSHVKQAQLLNVDAEKFISSRVLFFEGIYLRKRGDCRGAEKRMIDAYKTYKDRVYLSQLLRVGSICYTDNKDKKRIQSEFKKFINSYLQSIGSF
jgi:hypothetical protein